MNRKLLLAMILLGAVITPLSAQTGTTGRVLFDYPYNLHPEEYRSVWIEQFFEADGGRVVFSARHQNLTGQMSSGWTQVTAFQMGDSASLKGRGADFTHSVTHGNVHEFYYFFPQDQGSYLAARIDQHYFSRYLDLRELVIFHPAQPNPDTVISSYGRSLSRRLQFRDSLIYALLAFPGTLSGPPPYQAVDSCRLVAIDPWQGSIHALDTLLFPTSVWDAGAFHLSFADSTLQIAHTSGMRSNLSTEIWAYSLGKPGATQVDSVYPHPRGYVDEFGDARHLFRTDSTGSLFWGYQAPRGAYQENQILSVPPNFIFRCGTVTPDSNCIVVLQDTLSQVKLPPRLFKITPAGNIILDVQINIPYHRPYLHAVREEPSTGALWIGGNMEDSANQEHHYAFLARMDSTGAFVSLNAGPGLLSAWALYPQPAQQMLRVKNGPLQTHRYRILGLNGRLLQEGPFHAKEGISLTGLSAGIYLFEIQNSQGRTLGIRRFVKE